MREITQVVDSNLHQSVIASALQNALVQRPFKNPREQRKDVELHPSHPSPLGLLRPLRTAFFGFACPLPSTFRLDDLDHGAFAALGRRARQQGADGRDGASALADDL